MEVESRIAEVTLYARGACVRRITTIAVAEPRIRIVGLPLAVIDDTVRVEAEGGPVVTAVHVGVDAPVAAAAAEEEVAEVRAARLRAALADAEVERLDAALAALAAAPIAVPDPPGMSGLPGLPGLHDQPIPPWSDIIAARRALVVLRAERELSLREQAATARRSAADARIALIAARDRDLRAGSARAARLHELRKYVDLEIEGTGTATVHLEYQVGAARWAPSYVARLDGERVVLEVRAVVAQASGEDWTAVQLRLSTAEPAQFGALPELAAQRIGRRQREAARPGFRAPPSGAAALYLDYQQAFPGYLHALPEPPGERSPEPPEPANVIVDAELSREIWDEETSRAKRAFVMPPPGARPAPAAHVPAQPMTAIRTLMAAAPPAQRGRERVAPGPAGGGADRAERERSKPRSEQPARSSRSPDLPPRLDYANLRMAPPGSRDRGLLVPAPRDPRSASLADGVEAGIRSLNSLPLPPGCSASWPHTYDYAFATDGAVDVRSDNAWHSIAVTAKPTTVQLRHVAVPREQPDVFRLAAITNPLLGPLLPGPVDVYDRGKFLVTSTIEHTPPEARVEIGLGVDPAVKLARNTEFREETTGMLRGGLRLHHAIAVDIDNLSEHAIELEVRERLPVTRDGDDDIDVVVGRVEPAWERWTPDAEVPDQRRLRGGYRWRLSIPARTRRTLRAAYEVKIAGKLELVGGNRRES